MDSVLFLAFCYFYLRLSYSDKLRNLLEIAKSFFAVQVVHLISSYPIIFLDLSVFLKPYVRNRVTENERKYTYAK